LLLQPLSLSLLQSLLMLLLLRLLVELGRCSLCRCRCSLS
jgi:hypothetical protein